MKFKVSKSSELSSQFEEVDINTLEELLKFVEDAKNEVIIFKDEEDWELEIYDCYRE